MVWCYKENDTATRYFPRKHDVILYYARSDRHAFNVQRGDFTEAQLKRYNIVREDGSRWANMKGKLRKLAGGAKIRDWWPDIPIAQAKERTGYPTQKPLSLLTRIIAAGSNPGDVVLDPFCGCATACVAAEGHGRMWVGIDVGAKAAQLVDMRINDQLGNLLFKCVHRKARPKRTDLGRLPPYNCPANRKRLYGEQGGNCNGCGVHFEARNLEVDHIIDRDSGGTDHLSNLQLLCGNCNRVKGNRGMEYLVTKMQMAAPRNWR